MLTTNMFRVDLVDCLTIQTMLSNHITFRARTEDH